MWVVSAWAPEGQSGPTGGVMSGVLDLELASALPGLGSQVWVPPSRSALDLSLRSEVRLGLSPASGILGQWIE